MAWLGRFAPPPKGIFVVHGEPDSATALVVRVREELGWDATAPRYLDSVVLNFERAPSS
ncbi:MAG: hypothetical protein FJX76_14735 [Armatimonadetes bacterium]|nr:hypothetical protein [Armatimonadota bacterium]